MCHTESESGHGPQESALKQNKTPHIILIAAQPKFGNHMFILIPPASSVLIPCEPSSPSPVGTHSLLS